MGVTPSFYFNIPNGFNYVTIMFGYTDRFRLILAPPEVTNETFNATISISSFSIASILFSILLQFHNNIFLNT
jgi:hypothetical protein